MESRLQKDSRTIRAIRVNVVWGATARHARHAYRTRSLQFPEQSPIAPSRNDHQYACGYH